MKKYMIWIPVFGLWFHSSKIREVVLYDAYWFYQLTCYIALETSLICLLNK
jgi:hypothetical protein